MKKIKQLFAVALLLGSLASCKKDTLLTYSGNANIYFDFTSGGQPLDTTAITFGFSPTTVTDSVYKVPLKIAGPLSNTDRTFTIVVDTGTTAVAGTHYKLPATFVFHANKVVDSLPITIYRTKDEQTTPVILDLKLVPNNNFLVNLLSVPVTIGTVTDMPVNTFRVNISDMLVAGAYWTNVFSTYFGTFSVKKVQLINQVTGMPLDYITIIGLYDPNFSARITYYAITMANYLAAQKAAGHTVYEADGVTPMTMGAAYQ